MLPLNFNHLYYFYVVARAGSISQAAEELRVSQSSVSVQIKQFESSLGHTLFNRVKTGVELTDSGLIVFQYADELFHDAERLQNALEAVEHHLGGTISVGTVNSIGIYTLPALLKEFNDVYPDVKVGIVFKPPRELIEMARRNQLDFLLLTSNRQYPGLTLLSLRKIKLFLVAPAGHPLASLDVVSPGELEKYPFLGFEEGMETRTMIDSLFRRLSLSVEYAMESSNVAAIKRMMLAGLGLAILPETAVGPEIRRGEIIRLDVPSLFLTQELTLYHKTNRTMTPTRREFLKVVRHHLLGERDRRQPLKR